MTWIQSDQSTIHDQRKQVLHFSFPAQQLTKELCYSVGGDKVKK